MCSVYVCSEVIWLVERIGLLWDFSFIFFLRQIWMWCFVWFLTQLCVHRDDPLPPAFIPLLFKTEYILSFSSRHPSLSVTQVSVHRFEIRWGEAPMCHISILSCQAQVLRNPPVHLSPRPRTRSTRVSEAAAPPGRAGPGLAEPPGEERG